MIEHAAYDCVEAFLDRAGKLLERSASAAKPRSSVALPRSASSSFRSGQPREVGLLQFCFLRGGRRQPTCARSTEDARRRNAHQWHLVVSAPWHWWWSAKAPQTKSGYDAASEHTPDPRSARLRPSPRRAPVPIEHSALRWPAICWPPGVPGWRRGMTGRSAASLRSALRRQASV